MIKTLNLENSNISIGIYSTFLQLFLIELQQNKIINNGNSYFVNINFFSDYKEMYKEY